MLDNHCHILPAIDDGAAKDQETLEMLQAAKKAGITQIVCTPHCYSSAFNKGQVEQLCQRFRLQAQELGISLVQGCEVHWQALADMGLDRAKELCFEGSNHMLLEFSPEALPANWKEIIALLIKQDVMPIIAHPEVYRPVQKHISVAQELKEAGCMLQLSGKYFGSASFTHKWHTTGIKLLKAGLVDYVASDAHCVQDYQHFEHALNLAQKQGFIPQEEHL